ncbi:MAG: precorrin-2 C(20)-methyltransferase [Candidatus Omnitrophica bacterium]|nr:precorrin-2 C(20)-methyltransferase [Candidatus Omnitrophota bacterium]
MSQFGKLYGVGVGPGAEDLITLRAVRVLQNAATIAIPRRDEFTPSVAWRIAEPSVGEITGQERIFLNFPMTKNPVLLRPAWDIAFREIETRLRAGKSVAFVTEGDPFLYSTFLYLREHAQEHWPEIEVDVVPAVSSITAVPIAAGVPVADGQEKIAVLPATYGIEELRSVLKIFDTVLLMKVSSVMPEVCDLLESEGLLDSAVYVSKATTQQEKIVRDIKSIKNDRCDYFSMVVVSKRTKSGVLRGKLDTFVIPGSTAPEVQA